MKPFIFFIMFLFLFTGIANAAPDGNLKNKSLQEKKIDHIDSMLADGISETPVQAVAKGKQILKDAKEKRWFSMSAGIIWILMFLLKVGRKNFPFLQGMSKRWLYITVCLLSIVAMLLAKFQGDLSWNAALTVLSSGPCVAYLNDLLKRGIFGFKPSNS